MSPTGATRIFAPQPFLPDARRASGRHRLPPGQHGRREIHAQGRGHGSWQEPLHHAHSVIPHDRLLSIDERSANAAAKPVIIPETINCDRGRVYLSETFLRACSTLGISVQSARPYTGSDKSLVERTFSSVNTLFCQHVAGYTGRNTTRRGPDVAEDAVWTVAQLQELFDEWVVACWQSRPHEGLSHTWGEGRDPSPNERFAACVGISGYVPLPLTGDDYIELVPAVFSVP